MRRFTLILSSLALCFLPSAFAEDAPSESEDAEASDASADAEDVIAFAGVTSLPMGGASVSRDVFPTVATARPAKKRADQDR